MDEILFILVILIAFLLLVGGPIAISFVVYSFMKKKNVDKRLLPLAFIPILIMAYMVYAAIYPGKEFYQADFKEVTGTELPAGSEIGYKTATYPDHFGDYTSVFIVNIGSEFYNALPRILVEHGLSEGNGNRGTHEIDKALSDVVPLRFNAEYSMTVEGGVYYYVGFLSDNSSIIVRRSSW